MDLMSCAYPHLRTRTRNATLAAALISDFMFDPGAGCYPLVKERNNIMLGAYAFGDHVSTITAT